jgi:hypothetical protein
MSRKIYIAGVPVNVVSDEEASQMDFVVCMPLGSPTPFDDNETGACCNCGCAVIFRPYVPKGPPRICLQCAIERVQQ